jgi:hypothetical protein
MNNIFINENEDVFEVFDKYGVDYNKKLVRHLRFISSKQSNNYIGYYQFKTDDTYYKLYVLPKTAPRVEDVNENKKSFINLLKIYFKLKGKYPQIETKEIFDNIIDFGFDNKKDYENSDDIEYFIEYKYLHALNIINDFFRKHNRSILKEVDFISQSVKHKLHLSKNILELDKTKIHQTKKIPFTYSKFAIITIACLKYFLKKDIDKRTKSITKKLLLRLNHKYKMDNIFNFTISQVTNKKTTKLFKTNEQKELYTSLMNLIGIENYFEDTKSQNIFKLHHQHSIFFRPEKLYEWIVYDYIKEKYTELEVKKEPNKEYIVKKASIERKIGSYPDIVVSDNEKTKLYIIDAKWKVLGDQLPDQADILKLKRDCEVRRTDGREIYAILIYPQQNSDLQFYEEYLDDINEHDASFRFYSKTLSANGLNNFDLNNVISIAIEDNEKTAIENRLTYVNKTNLRDNEFTDNLSSQIEQYISDRYSEDEIFKNYLDIKTFLDNNADKISKKMEQLLKTSVSTLYYLDNLNSCTYFDYTLPASSIWKAIETEIKECMAYVIKDIRFYNSNITLGTYALIFKNSVLYKNNSSNRGDTYRAFKPFLEKLEKTPQKYRDFFEILTDDRNLYTHDEIMKQDDFRENIISKMFLIGDEQKLDIVDIINLKQAIEEDMNKSM